MLQKLTSRKFLAAIIGFITAMGSALNIADTTLSKLICVITAAFTLIVYIIAEATIDVENKSSTNYTKK